MVTTEQNIAIMIRNQVQVYTELHPKLFITYSSTEPTSFLGQFSSLRAAHAIAWCIHQSCRNRILRGFAGTTDPIAIATVLRLHL